MSLTPYQAEVNFVSYEVIFFSFYPQNYSGTIDHVIATDTSLSFGNVFYTNAFTISSCSSQFGYNSRHGVGLI